MGSHYVILADIIGSRDIEDRRVFRESLTNALDTVNDQFASAMGVPFEPIKGIDEFGGVLTDLAPIYELVQVVLHAIHPVEARIVVATGGIDVGHFDAGIGSLDGPAFHRADELLTTLSDEDLYFGMDTGQPADALVATTVNLLMMILRDRTSRQIEVVEAYEAHGTQTAAAADLDVPQQSISQTLQRAEYKRTKLIRAQFMSAITDIYE